MYGFLSYFLNYSPFIIIIIFSSSTDIFFSSLFVLVLAGASLEDGIVYVVLFVSEILITF